MKRVIDAITAPLSDMSVLAGVFVVVAAALCAAWAIFGLFTWLMWASGAGS